MKRLDGKISIVTGGASGIGLGIARRFLAEGAKVLITGRTATKLNAAVAELCSPDCLGFSGDVSVDDDAALMVRKAVEHWGGVDILVNNAGVVRRDRKLCEVDESDWDEHLAINLKSVFLMCKHAIPEMSKRGGGAIVNISSQLAFVAAPKYPAYCASKAGVVGLSRSIALDYAGERIRCNSVCPGLIETPLAYVQRENFDQLKSDIIKLHPLGRLGRPDDVASAVAFMACDDAAWITGQTLVVDGGYMIR